MESSESQPDGPNMQTHMKMASLLSSIAGSVDVENILDERDKCRVPGTDQEYFDCCFRLSKSSCEMFGTLNSALLLINVAIFIFLVITSVWFRKNRMLLATCVFQFAVIGCRIEYLSNSGYEGNYMITFMLFKTGGPGTTIISLMAFLLYVNQLTTKIEQRDDQEFNYETLKQKYSMKFLKILVVFALLWSGLLLLCFASGSLIKLNLAFCVGLLALGCLYWVAGGGLIQAVTNAADPAIREEDSTIPGKTTSWELVFLSVVLIFLRASFLYADDFARLMNPDQHNPGSANWRLIWFTQQILEIIGSIVVFSTIPMISRVETELDEGSEKITF